MTFLQSQHCHNGMMGTASRVAGLDGLLTLNSKSTIAKAHEVIIINVYTVTTGENSKH